MTQNGKTGIAQLPFFLRSRARLILVLSAVLGVPTVLLCVLINVFVGHTLEARALASNNLTAHMTAQATQEHFDGLMRYAESFATRRKFAEFVEQRDVENARPHLRAMVEQNPRIDRVILTDINGVLWCDYPADPGVLGKDFAQRDWFHGVSTKQSTYVSEIYQRSAKGQHYVVAIAAPVRNAQQQPVGYLVAQERLDLWMNWLKQAEPAALVDLRLADHHGNLVGLPHTPMTLRGRLVGAEGTFRADDPLSREASLINFVRVKSIDWMVISSRPLAGIRQPIRRVQYGVTGLALICFVSMLLVAFPSLSALRRELTERQKAEERLRASEELHRLVTETSLDAFISIDAAGKVREWNRQAERVFGWKHAEVAGKRLSEIIIPPALRSRHEEGLRKFLETGEGPVLNQRLEMPALHRDGHELPVEMTIAPLRLGETWVFNAFLHDITERKTAQDALDRQAAELERSNKELELFAYVASHDLQEPLRAVAGFMDLLRQRYAGKLDERADQYITFAVDGAKRMQSLINGLLEYSRVSTHTQAFEWIESEVALADALGNLQLAIAEAHGEITHDPLPAVFADPSQFSRLLQNLIGNALKFRGDQPARIHIASQSRDGEWEFSVRDNGIGIDPQFFERIFAIFQRLHTQREYSGTGLGLAICKRIVERHGGRIWLESVEGQGSTFHFTMRKLEKGATS